MFDAHSSGRSVRRSDIPASLSECAARSVAPYDVVSGAPSCPVPESDLRNPLPSPVSSAAAPPSFALPVRRCQSPPAPCAGAPSASLPRRQSSRSRTRTPCGSARKAPPSFSNPTSSSASGCARCKSTRSVEGVGQIKLPNWAISKYRNQGAMEPLRGLCRAERKGPELPAPFPDPLPRRAAGQPPLRSGSGCDSDHFPQHLASQRRFAPTSLIGHWKNGDRDQRRTVTAFARIRNILTGADDIWGITGAVAGAVLLLAGVAVGHY